jgi:hypothetical protein
MTAAATHKASRSGYPPMLVQQEYRDRMRKALGECTFLPASSHKRFARQVAAMYLDRITEKQWRHVIRLAWRYRRQMPTDLIPSKDAVEALDMAWAPRRLPAWSL